MGKDWQQSFSSKVVTPRHLKADQVTFADIGHALAQKIRFAGQLREMGYSVAQHCVLGAERIGGAFALPFLLHEVSEVYLPDVPSPIKPFLFVRLDGYGDMPMRDVPWEELEAQHADVIFEALGLSSIRGMIDTPEVHEMDLRMLLTEKRDLASPEPQPWGLAGEPLDVSISECWAPREAERAFNRMFAELVRARGSL